ncbi:hypothetical protein FYJ26_04105 [Anaerococcus sp. WCA-380-WT-2B]|uniref:Lipoprotein n=1 Tax=Anaerococcus porci TaxID=2652269 RepID=A0A6N7VV81_9FIRM|nr:hypothetical protein [Anaerococcus porci]MSS77599.1 hypothetical protein [Anaerococcus porci]
MNKKIIVALSLSLVLSACNANNSNKIVSNNKSLEVSDLTKKNKNNLEGEKKNSSNDGSNVNKDKENTKSNKKDLSVSELRDIMAKEAGFDQDIIDSLTDEDIKKYGEKAENLRKKTGFWNKLSFFLNEVAKDHPSKNSEYPLSSIIDVEENWVYTTDDKTDMYTNARRYIKEQGFDASNISNGELKKLFFDIYESNKLSSYDEQIDMATQKLQEKYEDKSTNEGTKTKETSQNDNNNTKDTNKNSSKIKGEGMGKFAQNKSDYDEFRKQLVANYGFDKNKINDITDADIDLANYRAQQKLEETGFGDIGLIIEEIGKMYPGYSTMYPGK